MTGDPLEPPDSWWSNPRESGYPYDVFLCKSCDENFHEHWNEDELFVRWRFKRDRTCFFCGKPSSTEYRCTFKGLAAFAAQKDS